MISIRSIALTSALSLSLLSASVLFAADQFNINKATAQTLSQLKGIGSKRANHIVQYRQERGGFKTVAELSNIKGLSDKSVKKLQQNNDVTFVTR